MWETEHAVVDPDGIEVCRSARRVVLAMTHEDVQDDRGLLLGIKLDWPKAWRRPGCLFVDVAAWVGSRDHAGPRVGDRDQADPVGGRHFDPGHGEANRAAIPHP